MKNTYLFFVLILIFVPSISFAQNAPMSGWSFNYPSVELNGSFLWKHQYAESWVEQEGYAIVRGVRRHYWLYDSYSYRSGRVGELYDRILPRWVEDMGYVIDFDNIGVYSPNENLASSIKALMAQKGCDISVTLFSDSFGQYLEIHAYDRSRDLYDTTIYPLYKGDGYIRNGGVGGN